MVEWLKIRDKNGDIYLVNADDIDYISNGGIVFRSGECIWIPIDVEEVERAIAESRKVDNRGEQERWLNGE